MPSCAKKNLELNNMTLTNYTDDFYQALGHLFYAVVAADKSVRSEEVAALSKLLDSEWSMETKTAHPVQIVFKQLVQKGMEAKEALAHFKNYKETNQQLFTEATRIRVWKTVNTLAESVAGKNKSELILLSKLSVLFEE